MTQSIMSCDEPEDWPKEFKEFRSIDSMLRCLACKEFLTAGTRMVVPCCHNFHFECLQRALQPQITADKSCPACRLAIQSQKQSIISNKHVDDLCKLFIQTRPKALSALNSATHQSSTLPSKEQVETERIDHRETLTPIMGDERRRKQRSTRAVDSYRKCMVCGKSSDVSEQEFTLHVNKCLDGVKDVNFGVQQQNQQLSERPVKRHKDQNDDTFTRPKKQEGKKPIKIYLPAMKDADIRKLLKQYNLPVNGSATDRMRRLQDYILMWNASCESLDGRLSKDIVNQVMAKEESSTQSVRKQSKQAQDDHFAELIAQAKAGLKRGKKESL
ncbi:hypothetical protein MP228_011781 [Amoeboaphelidium protococcarum]|nr:hypothetical protein MP228_011781 [Amoeboaphelidium protococcarum]